MTSPCMCTLKTRLRSHDSMTPENIDRLRRPRICGMDGSLLSRTWAVCDSRSIFFIQGDWPHFCLGKWDAENDVTAADPCATDRNVSNGNKDPRRRSGRAGGEFLPLGWRMLENGPLETRWKQNVASTQLPVEKFDPQHDQMGVGAPVVPLLCQEACNLLVAQARKIVHEGRDASPKRP